MSEINNAKADEHDIAIECTRTRACRWKGMESDLVGVPHKTIKQATQKVCPKCGCDTYYRRDLS
ncbi:hypothetical protein RA280_14605 [Cupriavidus sp. CV2]|uniref:hypothetical protein n=1 Tax=Cupriavidus ulmosensis TaxID=3065913 RepID=UPI00296B3587|nr:hypothetical protein [Cupriavidus sp. CV2]MDW3682957.1 hypothetical protein [Cupriavidus sp. CV2]